jgi:hypothetical protein
MDPIVAAATLMLIQRLITDGPAGVQKIMMAWQKVDPNAEDFEALIGIMEQERPKDPLKT